MITDTTATRLAHDLCATRELLSVALALLHAAYRDLAARERALVQLRQDFTKVYGQVQG